MQHNYGMEEFNNDPKKTYNFSLSNPCNGNCYNYIVFISMVRYQNGKAIEISVDRELRDEVKVSLYDLDVFHTPAEDVIRFMKQFGPCIHDEPDEQLSTEYEFPAVGIRFWRERAFHEKLLQDRAYVEAMQLVLEEEKRYLYFDIVTVKI